MIISANLKANLNRAKALSYLKTLDGFLKENDIKTQIFTFLPSSSLQDQEKFSKLNIGVQNAYPALNGAYTGELCLEQIKEFNIKSILLGHSERRTLLKEDNELIKAKFDFYAKENFDIFLCIGEPLSVKEKGEEATFNYLKEQLKDLDLNYAKLKIAYEPIWAIGTGKSASLKEIENTHKKLKSLCEKDIIYGGSVNAKNAKDILKIEEVNGALIGGFALNVEEFSKLIKENV